MPRGRPPMPQTPPLSLSDEEHAIIMQAAGPIDPADRVLFLLALAEELARHPVRGVGLFHRLAADLQRRFVVQARSDALTHRGEAHRPRRQDGAGRPVLGQRQGPDRPPWGRCDAPDAKICRRCLFWLLKSPGRFRERLSGRDASQSDRARQPSGCRGQVRAWRRGFFGNLHPSRERDPERRGR